MHKSIVKKGLITAAAILILLIIWEAVAYLVNIESKGLYFSGPIKTIPTFFTLIFTAYFWKTVLYSILRIISGFLLGIIFGCALAFLCKKLPFVNSVVSIGMSVIKATPVASIIMTLWAIFSGECLPVIIAILMVSPIIWQNLLDAFDSIDTNLVEVSEIFIVSSKKKFKLLVFPALMKFFIPAALTAMGLAWKSGIAAEIITHTAIGENIFNNRQAYEPEVMLSWTLTVILISLVFEKLIKQLTRRFAAK